MATGKPQKFVSNISNNKTIPDENVPDYGTTKELKNEAVLCLNNIKSIAMRSLVTHFNTTD